MKKNQDLTEVVDNLCNYINKNLEDTILAENIIPELRGIQSSIPRYSYNLTQQILEETVAIYEPKDLVCARNLNQALQKQAKQYSRY